MAYSNNGTCTTGATAQDILAEGHKFRSIVFVNESDTAMRIAVGATAAAAVGDLVAAGTSQIFKSLHGRKVSMLCATTGKAFSFREDV